MVMCIRSSLGKFLKTETCMGALLVVLMLMVLPIWSDVLVEDFEDGLPDNFITQATDSSTILMSCDVDSPLAGSKSASYEFNLVSNEGHPWFQTIMDIRNKDLRDLTGIRMKIKTTVPLNINFLLSSTHTPFLNQIKGLGYCWWVEIDPSVSEIYLPISTIELNPHSDPSLPSSGQTPTIDEYLKEIANLCIQGHNPEWMQGTSGTLVIDDIIFEGVDSLEPGISPSLCYPWWANFEQIFLEDHPDSIPHTYTYSNTNSSISFRTTTENPILAQRSGLISSDIEDNPGQPYSGYAGVGILMSADGDAYDLSDLKRIEMSYKTSENVRIRMDLISDIYGKELIDSGIVYCWEQELDPYHIPNLGAEFLRNSLSIPQWAEAHTRLTALLPPIDSVLSRVHAININVLSPGESSLKMDYFCFSGVDSLRAVERLVSRVTLDSLPDTVKTSSFSLSWSRGSNNASEYIVMLTDSISGETTIDTVTDTTLTVENLQDNHVYKYSVQPVNDYGYGITTPPARFVTSLNSTASNIIGKNNAMRISGVNSSIRIHLPKRSEVRVFVYGLNGKLLLPKITRCFDAGVNSISLKELPNQMVVIKVKSGRYSYTGPLNLTGRK